jgi:glycosyltransferase involved in cell wall biosynthesis
VSTRPLRYREAVILVFSRSEELNGTNAIKRTLTRLRPDRFRAVNAGSHLFRDLATRQHAVEAIVALSDTEYIVAVCVTQLLMKRIPIVLCVYNPKQWLVTLDARYCARRASVFRRLLSQMSERNILYCNEPVRRSCGEISAVASTGTVIVPPVEKPIGSANGDAGVRGDTLEIVTVGRFVDFKVASIRGMIDVVEALNARGMDVTYSLYGTGPLADDIASRIAASTAGHKIRLKGIVASEKFDEEVRQYDLFFGMGTALVRAAMAGLPGLVAIEDESAHTYGLFCDYDHRTHPSFGERNSGLPRRTLEEAVADFASRSPAERNMLSAKSREAAEAYDAERVIERMVDFVAKSTVSNHSRISVLDLVVIRIQTWISRLRGRPYIHA